ncbi:hypothetical protein [Desulforudis sp. DRI-14]
MDRIEKALDEFNTEIRKALRKFERDLIKWMFIFSVSYVAVLAAMLKAF